MQPHDPIRASEVDFKDVPPEERRACLVYEMAREFPTLRTIIEQPSDKLPPRELPHAVPFFILHERARERHEPFLLRNGDGRPDLDRGTPFLIRGSWLKPNTLLEGWGIHVAKLFTGEAQWSDFVEEFGPLLRWKGQEDRPPYFPSRPFMELEPTGRRERSIRCAITLGPVQPPDPVGDQVLYSITKNGVRLTIHVHYQGHTDQEIFNALKPFIKQHRPDHFPAPPSRSGHEAPHQQAAIHLRRLAACRLCAHYSNPQSVPPEFRPLWYRNPTEMRKNCEAVERLSHIIFPFLDPDERPECFKQCLDRGRFGTRGRPRKY